MRRWKTQGGVVVLEAGRLECYDARLGRWEVKIRAYRQTKDGKVGGYHGLLWLKNLKRVKP